MAESTVADVRRILAEVLELDPGAVAAEASTASLEAWDSIAHLNLILALEQELGVAIPPEEMADLTSVAALAARIDELR